MTLTILCPPCRDEYAAWTSAPYLGSELTEYTVTDKREDLTRLNRDRFLHRVRTQQRLIRDHCTRSHAKGDAA